VHHGHTRLETNIEEIIKAAIEQVYLTRQRPSVQKVVTEIRARCRAAGIPPPHPNTIRRRIASIPPKVEMIRRHGSQAARVYDPIASNFPIPDTPLGVVQIDHTKVDLILVDDISRQTVGPTVDHIRDRHFQPHDCRFLRILRSAGSHVHGFVHCAHNPIYGAGIA
jgi:putative transposase